MFLQKMKFYNELTMSHVKADDQLKLMKDEKTIM